MENNENHAKQAEKRWREILRLKDITMKRKEVSKKLRELNPLLKQLQESKVRLLNLKTKIISRSSAYYKNSTKCDHNFICIPISGFSETPKTIMKKCTKCGYTIREKI